jgi:hypothetical protein
MYSIQETDSKSINKLPSGVYYPIQIPYTNETSGGNLYENYFSIPIEADIIWPAYALIHEIDGSDLAKRAAVLLSVIQEEISSLTQFNVNISHLPQLRGYVVVDGSILFEWIFPDFRLGFNIELDSRDSSWFLIANRKFGEITASGYLSGIEMKDLILWLLNFILVNT